LDTIGEAADMYTINLSPDETHLLVDVQDLNASQWDIWSYDLLRGIRTRMTFSSGDDGGAKWHPSGDRFVFASTRIADNFSLFTKAANGVGEAKELLLDTTTSAAGIMWPLDWSNDGKHIVYAHRDSGRADVNLWTLPLDDPGNPVRLTHSEFEEIEAVLSPDGQWLAYTSDESGDEEVYVAPYPGMGSKWQVSINQGDRPRWRKDGRELFYLSNEDEIMAVDVDGIGTSFKIGKVTRLFQTNPERPGNIYQVYGDGQKFIINTNIAPTDVSLLTLVMNWDLELPDE